MAKEKPLQKSITSAWFLDLCVSWHLYKNCSLFKSTYVKNINSVTVVRKIIKTNKIGTIAIPIANNTTIKLYNIIFALQYNSNLISFSQLRKNKIIYHNNPTLIILMKDRKTVAPAKRE